MTDVTPEAPVTEAGKHRAFEYRVERGTSLGGHIRVLWVRLDLGQGREWVAVGRVNK